VVDALHDARLAQLLLAAVSSPEGVDAGGAVTLAVPGRPVEAGSALFDDDPDAVLTFDERTRMRVFSWLRPWPHPGVAFLVGLDEAGFNHLQPPVAVWRRDGRDLGVIEELLVGAAPGWAVALGSLRDVCASGCPPEQAGGDFAPEARALGTMVARMHRALDRAFGRRMSDVATMAEEAGSAVADVDAAALDGGEVAAALRGLRAASLAAPAVRVHGDLHLGRIARCDQGWVLADCMPGGTDPLTGAARYRSPLADVADLLWSLGHVAAVAAADLARDPLGHRAGELAAAWEARNRRALLDGYLGVAGPLVPGDPAVVRDLLVLLELEREARMALRRHPSRTRP
jgi:maltokinase